MPSSKPAADVIPSPKVGDRAPTSAKLPFVGKPTLVMFLRNCGDPFAEKNFRNLAEFSDAHRNIHCVAVSNSSQAVTDKWVEAVGGEWEVQVVVDESREIFSAWGLPTAGYWHVYGPLAILNTVRLAQNEKISDRSLGSEGGGSRGSVWQTGGVFAIDGMGVVRWARVSPSSDDVPDLKHALAALRTS